MRKLYFGGQLFGRREEKKVFKFGGTIGVFLVTALLAHDVCVTKLC